jgi:dolichol-phosphate mannosyltransferase
VFPDGEARVKDFISGGYVNSTSQTVELDIVLPVHNEGESIEATIREIYEEISPKVAVRFVICEDGSKDNTKEVLRKLSESIPMVLDLSDARKGYSRAVIDAFKMVKAPYALALDSDGQCEPKDFWQFWERRDSQDVLIGWRVDRADPFFRRWMSKSFKAVHSILFHPHLHDPSCPYLLIHREVLEKLVPELGILKQGFWWEFVARVVRQGFSIAELPVTHRERAAGMTRVYTMTKIPGIAYRHLLGLWTIYRETRS